MALVIKGSSRGGAGHLAAYALAVGKNESTAILEIRGTLAGDVKGAFAEMEALAKGKSGVFLYHLQVCPEEKLTREQLLKSADKAEKELKLEGHQRVIWEDVKDGKAHLHVAWNRVDPHTGKLTNMGNNYRAHERAAAELEKEFGLEPLARRPNLEGGRKGNRAPEGWEYRVAERDQAMNPREVKALFTELYAKAANGREFAELVKAEGWTLGKGEKSDFVLIPPEGEGKAINAARRIEGAKIADIREKFADLDRLALPTEKEARAVQAEGVAHHHTPEQQRTKTGATIQAAFAQDKDGAAIVNKASAEGVLLSRATPADVLRIEGAREAAAEAGIKQPPKIEAGEVVAVNERGQVVKLTERNTDTSREQIEKRTSDLEALPSITAAQERQQWTSAALASEKAAEREQKATDRQTERQQEQTEKAIKSEARAIINEPKKIAQDVGAAVDKVGIAARPVLKMANGLAAAVDGLLDGFFATPAPKKAPSLADYLSRPEARQEYAAAKAAEARAQQERENTLDDLRSGRTLDEASLRNLNKDDLLKLKELGINEGVQRILDEQRQLEEAQRLQQRQRR